MERYLITQTLLSSWGYTFDCWEGGEEKAMTDFKRTLAREKMKPPSATFNGIAFENACYAAADNLPRPAAPEWMLDALKYPVERFRDFEGVTDAAEISKLVGKIKRTVYAAAPPEWDRGVNAVASVLRGAQFQVKVSAPLEVDGMAFVLHGVLDGLKAGTIFDVKFTNTKLGSMDAYGKYLESPQHPAYFELVPEAHTFQYLLSDGDDLYIETYPRNQTCDIRKIISDFIRSITLMGLLDTYKARWQAL